MAHRDRNPRRQHRHRPGDSRDADPQEDHRKEAEDYRRERERRGRHQRLRAARDTVADMDMPDVPDLSTVRALMQEARLPAVCGDTLVVNARITAGDPLHGEMMSNDHVSVFELEYPGECPECGYDRIRWKMRRNHNIAGGHSEYCPDCEHVLESEDWG